MNNHKEDKKIAIMLLGSKPTRNTLKNLFASLSYIIDAKQFTGKQVCINAKAKPTWFYDTFLPRMLKAGIFEDAGTQRSSGALGRTQIYRITDRGLLVACYLARHENPRAFKILKEVLARTGDEEENPLVQVSARSLMQNYPEDAFWRFIGGSLYKAFLAAREKRDLDIAIYEHYMNSFFDVSLFSSVITPSKEDAAIFEKNISLMESSPWRHYIFWCYKTMIESHLLNFLKGEKLIKYFKSIWESPRLFHIPCLNDECNDVIVSETLILPRYCDGCKNSKS